MSSLIVGMIFLMSAIVGIIAWGALFWLGAKWTKIAGVSLARAISLGAAVALIRLGVNCSILLLASESSSTVVRLVGVLLLDLGAGLIGTFILLKTYVRASLGRIILAWLPTLLASGVSLLLAMFVVRPYLCEAFVVAANDMAPTLLGKHWTGPCPRCGAAAYASAPVSDVRSFGYDAEDQEGELMICSREMKSCRVANARPDPASPDRFVVCKILRPQRWDLVAFHFPGDPSRSYVKRLVGLPGETVIIDEGAVWIDGQKLTAPDGQHYLSSLTPPGGGSVDLWGTKENPAPLGPDEYFVLGDFSENSADSRTWSDGAVGHPSYAVPASHLIGVVTHIYWPRERMRVLK